MDPNLGPVLVGLSAGIILLGMVASFSQSQAPVPLGPLDTQRPRYQFGDAAIKIALQNVTQDPEFRGKDLIINYYRDYGVGYSPDSDVKAPASCPMNRCAYVAFYERDEPSRWVVSVIVNMDSKQVVFISKASNVSITD